MTQREPETGSNQITAPVILPVPIGNASLAEELRGGEDIRSWVANLRRKYPQNSALKVLQTY